jgi:hypothetical protein
MLSSPSREVPATSASEHLARARRSLSITNTEGSYVACCVASATSESWEDLETLRELCDLLNISLTLLP